MRAIEMHKELAFNYTSEQIGTSRIILADCFEWLRQTPEGTLHAVVTDPPCGAKEHVLTNWKSEPTGTEGIG